MLGTFWKDGAEVKRFRGSPEAFARDVPKAAPELKVIRSLNRFETFVTRDAPTLTVFKPTGAGLELSPITHPNDLVAGSPAQFRFLLQGKPAPDLEVTVVPGGARYRDAPGDVTLRTDADGTVSFTFPEAGMYWLGARAKGADDSNVSYVVTLEVLRP
ncbi:DUF4198 domain-containing protein [Caulobacter endophyticus]|uniref:DUF4198 domain-containing protein n=1 Tax=Caulobacter endophyticus TaxID=2172652 RepID=UPI0024109784|nr:DUF4198 domain-containing protein [Caulobacter endophyticus]MDG2528161.1 DUF4198 domain-containing protein [Caulobacter endophyticus]